MITWIIKLMWILLLSVIAWIDYKEQRIPNKILTLGLILQFCLFAIQNKFNLPMLYQQQKHAIFVAGLYICILFGVFVTSKGAIGLGDVKLFGLLGYSWGIEKTMTILFLSFLLASVYIVLKFLFKREEEKKRISFAPFIWGSFLLCISF